MGAVAGGYGRGGKRVQAAAEEQGVRGMGRERAPPPAQHTAMMVTSRAPMTVLKYPLPLRVTEVFDPTQLQCKDTLNLHANSRWWLTTREESPGGHHLRTLPYPPCLPSPPPPGLSTIRGAPKGRHLLCNHARARQGSTSPRPPPTVPSLSCGSSTAGPAVRSITHQGSSTDPPPRPTEPAPAPTGSQLGASSVWQRRSP